MVLLALTVRQLLDSKERRDTRKRGSAGDLRHGGRARAGAVGGHVRTTMGGRRRVNDTRVTALTHLGTLWASVELVVEGGLTTRGHPLRRAVVVCDCPHTSLGWQAMSVVAVRGHPTRLLGRHAVEVLELRSVYRAREYGETTLAHETVPSQRRTAIDGSSSCRCMSCSRVAVLRHGAIRQAGRARRPASIRLLFHHCV